MPDQEPPQPYSQEQIARLRASWAIQRTCDEAEQDLLQSGETENMLRSSVILNLLATVAARDAEIATLTTHRDQLHRDLTAIIEAIQPEEPTIQGCIDTLQGMRENWERDLRTIDALRDEVFDTITERDRYKQALEQAETSLQHMGPTTQNYYASVAEGLIHAALHPVPPSTDA